MSRDHQRLEIASPILQALTRQIEWPPVPEVPRLGHMEVMTTNVTHAYFDNIRLGPMGFRVNMLRSASGRAFLALCQPPAREAVLQVLRRSDRKGGRLARSKACVRTLLAETRAQGFGLRDPDFGGDCDEGRSVVEDGRDSPAAAIRLPGHVPGTLTITWSRKVLKRPRAIALLAAQARLPGTAPTTIKPKDSRCERGTTPGGGQVTRHRHQPARHLPDLPRRLAPDAGAGRARSSPSLRCGALRRPPA